MPLTTFQLKQFRNIKALDLEFSERFNVFYGDNGSGKTSLLESIYYLGLGRSFRSHLFSRIVQHRATELSIFTLFQDDAVKIPIGMQRSCSGLRQIRCNGETLTTMAPIAKLLPILLISTDSYRLFYDGSKPRRQFLDWGVFHVKHSFYNAWKNYQQALKQRNAALKNGLSFAQTRVWDQEIFAIADSIDCMRLEVIEKLRPILSEQLARLLDDFDINLSYRRGWDVKSSLESVFQTQWQRDSQLGYTQYGPHRADIRLSIEGIPVQDALSQGQQKLASYALYLSLGILLKQMLNKNPIYLIDDLPSELDPSKRKAITEILSELDAQVFITGIIKQDMLDLIQLPEVKLFHVKHGEICDA